jgi:hypothetical protein
MPLKAKHIAIFAVLSVAIYTACRKDVLPDDPPIPPDPCAGVVPVHANFKVYESRNAAGAGLIIESDTIMVWSAAVLVAEYENADSYEWRINGNSYYGQIVVYESLSPPVPTLTEPLVDTVTLIVRKADDPCFPEHVNSDTVTRLVTTMPRASWPFLGSFQGTVYENNGAVYLNNITINIIMDFTWYPDPSNAFGETYIQNLDGANCNLYVGTWSGWRYYKHFEYYHYTSVCNSSYGVGRINATGDSLIFRYQKSTENKKVTNIIFKGKRL